MKTRDFLKIQNKQAFDGIPFELQVDYIEVVYFYSGSAVNSKLVKAAFYENGFLKSIKKYKNIDICSSSKVKIFYRKDIQASIMPIAEFHRFYGLKENEN